MTTTEKDVARARWLEVRRSGLGGSDLAAICGASVKKPIEVWEDKRGIAPPDVQSDEAYWGHVHEPGVARRWAADTGLVLLEVPTMRRTDRPWHLGTPDRFGWEPIKVGMSVGGVSGEPIDPCDLAGTMDLFEIPISAAPIAGIELADEAEALRFYQGAPAGLHVVPRPDRALEIKTHGWPAGSRYGEEGTDQVPQDKRIQVCWYMALFDLPVWDLAGLSGTNRDRTFRVHRDLQLEAVLLEEGEHFWGMVQRGERPEPDGSDAFQDHIRRTFPAADGTEKIADVHAVELAYQLKMAKQAKAAAVEREKTLSQDLQLVMGAASRLVSPEGQLLLTWNRDKVGKLQETAFQHHLRDLAGMTDEEYQAAYDRFRGEPGRKLLCKIKGSPE
jgi:predicted phage-related endonuclease